MKESHLLYWNSGSEAKDSGEQITRSKGEAACTANPSEAGVHAEGEQSEPAE